eukprot:1192288-Prorocentrum_minimum.AAC.6
MRERGEFMRRRGEFMRGRGKFAHSGVGAQSDVHTDTCDVHDEGVQRGSRGGPEGAHLYVPHVDTLPLGEHHWEGAVVVRSVAVLHVDKLRPCARSKRQSVRASLPHSGRHRAPLERWQTRTLVLHMHYHTRMLPAETHVC